jgi:uncharacterized protein (DUF952 family)
MVESFYHITTSNEWNQAKQLGIYQLQGFERDQFIHCSYRHQLTVVANECIPFLR